jgi:hypothetical protein
LAGLDIFYDFDWRSIFCHDRAIFPNGQSLSELARRDCPHGKEPALLLTVRDDAEARVVETDDRFVVIVRIREYLRDAGGDAASTYYARLAGKPLTRLPTLSEISFTPSELAAFLDANLTTELLSTWAASSEARSRVLSEGTPASANVRIDEILEALRDFETLDDRLLDEFVAYSERFAEDGGMEALLDQVTRSGEGRLATTRVLADRLGERIADTRDQIAQYQQLIGSASVTETDVQGFLERNPWIVGLNYARARARVEIPRGEIDFVLDRYDGFFDIVELKGPGETIVKERTTSEASDDRPPAGSSCSLGSALANALAQAHLYRSILDRSRDLNEQYGLQDTRQPRIIILLGRSTNLTTNGHEILRELNVSLHRVEVVPYDLLGKRMTGLLDNIEALTVGRRAS